MNRLHRYFCRSPKYGEQIERRLIPWVLGSDDLGDDVLEIGPGPGMTTNVIRTRAPKLTTVEIDPKLAAALRSRLPEVTTVQADATEMPFESGRFSATICFTMLHHVPSVELQDKLLAEVHRVLRPGGVFLGSDSRGSTMFGIAHWFDTMVVVDPAAFAQRLAHAGFRDPLVDARERAFRFRAVA